MRLWDKGGELDAMVADFTVGDDPTVDLAWAWHDVVGSAAHVRVQLATGRTHQIRVHLTHVGYPLVGDQVYGKRLVVPRSADTLVAEGLRNFRRQALHAAHLAFKHPLTGKDMAFDADLPADFAGLLALLRRIALRGVGADPRRCIGRCRRRERIARRRTLVAGTFAEDRTQSQDQEHRDQSDQNDVVVIAHDRLAANYIGCE